QHQRAGLVGDEQRAALLQGAHVVEEGVGAEAAGVSDEPLPHWRASRAATTWRSRSRSAAGVSRPSASSKGWKRAAGRPLSVTRGVWPEQRMTNHVTRRGTPLGLT